jgi:hypothetical protein
MHKDRTKDHKEIASEHVNAFLRSRLLPAFLKNKASKTYANEQKLIHNPLCNFVPSLCALCNGI